MKTRHGSLCMVMNGRASARNGDTSFRNALNTTLGTLRSGAVRGYIVLGIEMNLQVHLEQ